MTALGASIYRKEECEMSRPRGYAAEDAKRAFCKELEHRMLDLGISSKKELAIRAGMDPRTIYRRFEDVSKMDIADLAAFKDILCPDPLLLLKAIGYSQKEIERSYHRAQAL